MSVARIAVAALAGSVCFPPAVSAQSPAASAERAVLTVRGSATVERRPDRADLAVSIVTHGPTLEAAARAHRPRVAQAASVLERIKAGGAEVDEGSFGLAEEMGSAPAGEGGRPAPPSYRAETRYGVTVRSLDRLDDIVATLVANGLFEIGSARYAVEREGDVLDDVRRAAMADARHQAEIYAAAGGVALDGIARIVDGEAGGGGGVMPLAMRRDRSASVGIVPPKALPFQGSVSVTWRILPR